VDQSLRLPQPAGCLCAFAASGWAWGMFRGVRFWRVPKCTGVPLLNA
jgi:hypothetical protein